MNPFWSWRYEALVELSIGAERPYMMGMWTQFNEQQDLDHQAGRGGQCLYKPLVARLVALSSSQSSISSKLRTTLLLQLPHQTIFFITPSSSFNYQHHAVQHRHCHARERTCRHCHSYRATKQRDIHPSMLERINSSVLQVSRAEDPLVRSSCSSRSRLHP